MIVSYNKKKTIIGRKKGTFTCMMKGEATLPNITSPDMIKYCEVIDECPYETSTVVMEDFVDDEHDDSIRNIGLIKMIQK